MASRDDKKGRVPTIRQFLVLLPFAPLYAAFIVLGNWRESADYSNLQNVGRILLWTLVSYLVLLVLCWAIANRGALAAHIPFLDSLAAQRRREGKRYVFALFFLACLFCYLPYYLMYYPTWFNNDAVWQLEQILGWKARSNHHPYFHTMIIQFFFQIGYGFFGNYTDAVGFYTFWQMAFVALAFAFYLYVLYRRGVRLLWLGLAAAFYVLLPVHGLLSICMGKDSFFVAALLLFAWVAQNFVPEKEGKVFYAAFFFAGLLVCLLRSNGIFIFLGTACVLVLSEIFAIFGKKASGEERSPACAGQRKRFLRKQVICIAAVLLCYLFYHGPVLRALQVEPPDAIEGLTMPAQHLMCTYVKGGNLTEEEVAMIDRVAPVEGLADHYNPYLFDIAKAYIREQGDQRAIEENKWAYCKLWMRAGLRNPMLYLEAEVRQTAGYWAYRTPHDQYLYGEYFMVDNPFGITAERKLFTYDQSLAMGRFLTKFQELYHRVWSIGLSTWVLLFALAYMVYRRKRAMFCAPFVMLLVSLLLAAPVYNEFRYAYGLFAAFPLLFGYAFGPSYTGEGEGDVDFRRLRS